jgi:hypothetical protein
VAALASAALLVWAAADVAIRAQPARWPCDVRTGDRIVAVGDVHGAFEAFAGILRTAGLIDSRGRWTGGRAVLVQTGDVLDRGADSRRVLDLLRKLEREAPRAGGRVLALLGNHEFMRLAGDWRFVSAGEFAAFRDARSEDRRDLVYEKVAAEEAARARSEGREHDERAHRERFMRDIPLGFIEMRQAFDADGDYGRWLRSRPALAKVNDLFFLHGGISPPVAALGCEAINERIARDMAALPLPAEQIAGLFASSGSGPLWYRGLANDPEETIADAVEASLVAMDGRAFVIGHTTVLPGRIATRLRGRVVQIDTGMLGGDFYRGGLPAALEIRGTMLTAIYPDRRETVAAPAIEAPAAGADAASPRQ